MSGGRGGGSEEGEVGTVRRGGSLVPAPPLLESWWSSPHQETWRLDRSIYNVIKEMKLKPPYISCSS